MAHEGQHGEVVARQQGKTISAEPEELRQHIHVARRLFHRGDLRDLGQAGDGCRLDVHRRATGHVVDAHLGLDRLGDGAKVPVEALLGGLVVVRRRGEHAICTRRDRTFGVQDRGAGIVAADASHHRHPSRGGPHTGSDHSSMLVHVERGRFAGGATRHQPLHAAGDLGLDQALVGAPRRKHPLERA